MLRICKMLKVNFGTAESKLNIYIVLKANFNSKEEHQPCI